MPTVTAILCIVVAFVVSGVLFGFIAFKKGVAYRKQVAETELGTAEEQARHIIEFA